MSGPGASLLGVAVMNGLVAACACVAVLVARRCGVRPSILHAAWLVVLVRLLVPPVVTVPMLPNLAPERPVPWTSAATSVPAVGSGAIQAGGSPPPSTPASSTPDAVGVVIAVWATGSAAIALIAMRRRRRMARLVAAATAPSAWLAGVTRGLADELGLSRSPRIAVVDARVSPMLWSADDGPCIVLPSALLRELGKPALESIVAHELAHLRRRDHWTRRLELVATIACWWLPPLWWARAGLRRAEERCCDEWVLRIRPALATTYARALVETAAFCHGTNGRGVPLPALASGAGPVRQLEERLTMIISNRRSKTVHWPQRVVLAGVAVAALVLAPAALDTTAGEPVSGDSLLADARLEGLGPVEGHGRSEARDRAGAHEHDHADAERGGDEVRRSRERAIRDELRARRGEHPRDRHAAPGGPDLERRFAELIERRRAIELEIERLAELRELEMSDRRGHARAMRDVRHEERRALAEREREMARALRDDARARGERARHPRGPHPLAEAERARALAREPGEQRSPDRRRGFRGDDALRALRTRLEATILELEADGLTEHADTLRRELETLP